MQLPPTRQPKAWKTLVNSGLDSLDTKLLAFFPGPMDGFQTFHSPIQAEGALDEVRTLLKGDHHLSERRASFSWPMLAPLTRASRMKSFDC